jgi:hypothetical protein
MLSIASQINEQVKHSSRTSSKTFTCPSVQRVRSSTGTRPFLDCRPAKRSFRSCYRFPVLGIRKIRSVTTAISRSLQRAIVLTGTGTETRVASKYLQFNQLPFSNRYGFAAFSGRSRQGRYHVSSVSGGVSLLLPASNHRNAAEKQSGLFAEPLTDAVAQHLPVNSLALEPRSGSFDHGSHLLEGIGAFLLNGSFDGVMELFVRGAGG